MATLENGRFSPRLESVITRWCEEITDAQTALTRQIAEGREQLGRLAELLSAGGPKGVVDVHSFHVQVSALQQELERQEIRAAEAEHRLSALNEERAKLAHEVVQLRTQSPVVPEEPSPAQRQRERGLEKDLRRARARIASLEESAAQHAREAEDVTNALHDAEDRAIRLESETEALRVSGTRSETDLQQARERIAALEESAGRQAREILAAADALRVTEDKAAQLQSEIEALRESGERSEYELLQARERIASLEESSGRQLSELQSTANALRTAEDKATQLQSEIEVLRESGQRSEDELRQTRARITALEESRDRQTSELQTTMIALREAEDKILRAQSETQAFKELWARSEEEQRQAHLRIASLQETGHQQARDLQAATDALQESDSKAARLQSEAQTLREFWSRSEEELREAQARIASLDTTVETQSRQGQVTSQDLQDTKAELQRLRGESEKLRDILAKNELEKAELHARVDKLSSESNALAETLHETQTTLEEYQRSGAMREAALRRASDETPQLREQVQSLLYEKQVMTEAHAQAISQWNQQWNALETSVNQIRGQLREVGEYAGRLQQELQKIQSEAQTLQSDKNALESQLADANKRLGEERSERDSATVEREALRSWLALEKEAHAAARTARDESRVEIHFLRGQTEKLDTERQTFQREATEAAQRARQAETDLQSVMQELRQSRDNLQRMAGENKTLETEAARRLARVAELQDLLAALREKISALEAQKFAAEQELEQTRSNIGPLQTQLAEQEFALRTERRSFSAEKLSASMTVDELKKEIAALKQQLAQRETELRMERESLETEKVVSSRIIDELRKEISPLKTELAERDVELRTLRDRATQWEKDLERAGGHWVEQRGVLTRELELFRSRLLTDAVFFLEPLTEELENLQLRQEAVGTLLEGLQRNAAPVGTPSADPSTPSDEALPENVRPLGLHAEPQKGRMRQASM